MTEQSVSSPTRYGCFNRLPFFESYQGQQGWRNNNLGTRIPVMMTIATTMSKDCQYSKGTIDSRCIGCQWKATNG